MLFTLFIVSNLIFLPHQAFSQDLSSYTRSLTSNTLNVSSKEDTLMAQDNSTGNCPVKLPSIKSTIVFQSVEAPQIEPISKQALLPYNDYDLVMGKPASLLVQLDRKNMDKDKKFIMYFYISKHNQKALHNKAFKRCYKHTRGTFKKDDWCVFTKTSLGSHAEKGKNSYYKFFQLPMNEAFLNKGNKSNHLIYVSVIPKGYHKNKSCIKTKKVKINIIKTHDLNIGFTSITGLTDITNKKQKQCYNTSSLHTVKKFVASSEMSSIKTMFPVNKLSRSYLKTPCKGHCDNEFYKGISIGILSDIAELEILRAFYGYNKLIAIAPQSYFDFHYKSQTGGFGLNPHWKRYGFRFLNRRWLKSGFLGGSWNIAFVKATLLNKGVVAHELAHTLGQGREFYKKTELACQQFRGDTFEACRAYKIPRALDTWVKNKKRHWKFVKNIFSIMYKVNKDTINDRWIDRDTYQKAFQVLSKHATLPNTYERPRVKNQQTNTQASMKAIVVGFYDEKKRKLIASHTKIQHTKLSTPSLSPKTENTKFPVITFQLKEGEKTLQTIKQPVLKMEMEVFYENKAPQTKPFGLSPLIAAFKLPSNHQHRNLKIVVLDPWKKQMLSIPLKKRDEPINVSVNLIDKNKKRM